MILLNSTTQSEEPTSRQVNQTFEDFLQQVRARECGNPQTPTVPDWRVFVPKPDISG
jgi:hypothetical protein